ncbi:unnamed protein product [Ranitomeya imitator]|uniref:Tc1-like transposase DDE domain-containing protein n=1 Tax=Ranitomeya imitator TaxID=111125 RepID=A0ABN9MG72_9NEOB|nr:unnamed protein product [Ranitomeya imitator]
MKALKLWTGPACSPDLNPIEHIWGIISRTIHQYHVAPQTIQELADALVQVWEEIPQEPIRCLIRSMPRRFSTSSLAQQYAHPNPALHPHPPHPQPSATPTGQQQSQHGGSHPAPSPVQHHHQHQTAQALHLANQQQQSAIYHTGLAPTPPSMTPGSNAQSPQNSFPTQQTVFTIHPSHVQPAYTNPPHMAHVQQAHVQSGMVPSHPTGHPMMLMTAQPPGGPQAALAQSALQPIPVSTTAHFPYMTHPPVQAHHQQQL